MNESIGLQVLHALADIQAYTQQGANVEATAPLSEEVQQTAQLHELSDDVDGSLLAAQSIELDQLRVGKFPAEKTGCRDQGSLQMLVEIYFCPLTVPDPHTMLAGYQLTDTSTQNILGAQPA